LGNNANNDHRGADDTNGANSANGADANSAIVNMGAGYKNNVASSVSSISGCSDSGSRSSVAGGGSAKCGIICEYNPFHNGHEYHLKKTRELLGEDVKIICVMSGDFVQRVAPSFFDKRLRARAAVDAGADCVVELPFLYATNGAERFSYGAVQVLSRIVGVKWLSFGVEGDIEVGVLNKIVDVQMDESDRFKGNLGRFLKAGYSFAAAKARATAAEFGDDSERILGVLDRPNNVLAMEYLIAIKKLGLDITPILIKRTDKGYNSLELKPPFASASAIRGLIENGQSFNDYVPKFVGDNFNKMSVDFKVFDAMARMALLRYEGDNAVLKKLKKAAQIHLDLDSIITSVKTKNMTYVSIKRLVLSTMCDITCEISAYKGDFFSKLLFMKKDFSKHLGDFSPHILISSDDEKRVSASKKEAIQIYKMDSLASDLYATITHNDAKRHFDKVF